MRKLKGNGARAVSCCYEAGPTGYALQRQLRAAGVKCAVIAPALIPKKPADRVKTDRRDARKLAELWRAGLLTEVHPPSVSEEAVRDLTRAWESLRHDVTRAQHRVSKLLLRQGRMYQDGKKSWTWRYRTWLRSLQFDEPATRAVFADWMLALEHAEERLLTRAAELEAIAQQDPYREPVAWLRCFYGIDTTAALILVAELYHVARFISPRHLMSWVGLVPSEQSSGGRTRRGGITKAGNRHVRWILCEIAHHYRKPARVGRALKKRREGQPAVVTAYADKAHQRLYRRFSHLLRSGKNSNQTVTAIARELVGFVGSVLRWAHEAQEKERNVA